jgi:hypothetical protein
VVLLLRHFNDSGRLFPTHYINNVSISYEFRLESVVDSFDLYGGAQDWTDRRTESTGVEGILVKPYRLPTARIHIPLPIAYP